MIQFDGLLSEASLDVLRETVGYNFNGLVLERGNISCSDNFSITAFNRFALAFSNSGKQRFIIFNAHSFQPHPSIWEQSRLTIQVIDPVNRPLKEKVLWPSQHLDSAFSVGVHDFDNEAIIKQFSLYGNKFEGSYSKCFPDLNDDELEEIRVLSTDQLEINSIELMEIQLANDKKLYVILREHGFDIEINSVRLLEEIINDYFDERYHLKLQHNLL